MHGGRSAGSSRRRASGLATSRAAVLLVLLLACGGKSTSGGAPVPTPPTPPPQAPSVASRVADLLARMTLDEKLGQMALVDRAYLDSESDIATYALGGVVSGGGSTPDPNTPTGWADMIDGFQRQALSSRLGIPILYGADGVHGHGNLYGATVFPQEIGLGAARDPELVQEIARATAEELAGTGVRWNFAPSVSVARDVRSGRTFESFGELPEIADSYVTFVAGSQGAALGAGPASVLATAKHWIADGATTDGKEFGNAPLTDAELRAIHMPPFQAAIAAGVGCVMIAHSSVDGLEMH
ncbi:MAG TPA: glycoside hydrolase family 3 N-terminal domain-containing protein, partial [Anaeromyxobacter sp.]|nr:glycoside hydrolase family 3 N-terminal domain-containing protein [Anaeromyxobacter sp.]